MTSDGGAFSYGYGAIFSIDTNGSGYTDLYNFIPIDGEFPNGSLTLLGGTIYGLAYEGGTDTDGVIFKFKDSAITNSINNLKTSIGEITLFPNPNNGQFTIQSSMESGKLSVEIYNMLGEKVYSQFNIQNPAFSIDLSSQPNGIYLYRVSSTDESLVGEGKLIIKK